MAIKRLKAFLIDYLLIVIYILLLLGVTLLISKIFHFQLDIANPVVGELIGFTTLTLPVILYFIITENSKLAGSWGKRKFKLQVVNNDLTKANFSQLLIRNCIKFLPWELAHFFIFNLFYFMKINSQTPNWVLTGLVISQGLSFIYLLFIIFNKSNRSIYEIFSQTRVIQNTEIKS